MHITVHCPSCGSQYQLDPGLRGQRMRCPNPICRQVFEVRGDGDGETAAPTRTDPGRETVLQLSPKKDPAVTPPRGNQQSGSVEELIPILPAESIDAPNAPPDAYRLEPVDGGQEVIPLRPAEPAGGPAEPSEAASWQVPPPVRRGGPATPEPAAEPPALPAEEPPKRPTRRDLPRPEPTAAEPPAWHAPPPVRRNEEPAGVPVFEPETAAAPATDVDLGVEPPASRGRRALWIVAAMIFGTGVIATIVIVATFIVMARAERAQAEVAYKNFEDARYDVSTHEFESLVQKYPKSDQLPRYRFFAELSQLLADVTTVGQAWVVVARHLDQFVSEHRDDPLLKENQKSIRQMYTRLAEQLLAEAQKNGAPDELRQAEQFVAEARRQGGGPLDPVLNKIQADIDGARAAIARKKEHQDLLAQIKALGNGKPNNDHLREARRLARQHGFDQDADVQNAIAALQDVIRAQVRYVSLTPTTEPAAAEPVEPSLLVAPLVAGASEASRPGGTAEAVVPGRVVLALVRGVLYALDQKSSAVRWALRVGIDTTALPVRLSARAESEEMFLVQSADRNTLMALLARNGRVFWQRKLSAPSLGRPVVVGRRAYVPTYDGRVYEIEIAKGSVLGYFDLNQRLTVGGTHQPDTDLLFIPGDSENLYVLDLSLNNPANQQPRPKACVMILHTGHPSGSLRSEPILINRPDPARRRNGVDWPGYLILNQADGLDWMKLRVFELPIPRPDAPPLLEQRVKGWSWFQPYHDTEKLAFVTDTGALGLFGVNQIRNQDQPIFPELKEEPRLGQGEQRLGRAQVVYAKENDFWVVANGEMQRFYFDPFRARMTTLWPNPLRIGSPLHAAQPDEAAKVIVLVTQDLARQVFLVTAVDANDGSVRWQRQLGLECQSDPVKVGGEVVMADRGGGMFVLSDADAAKALGHAWTVADRLLAEPLSGDVLTPHLVAEPGGKAVYEICPSGQQLVVRRFDPAADGNKLLEEQVLPLGRPLGGVPAVGPRCIYCMLADGTLLRFSLPLRPGPGESGPDWRSNRADEDAQGFVVPIDADDFLLTDGSRGLSRVHWPLGMDFRYVPDRRPPTTELPARIVAPPVVLNAGAASTSLDVVVADADDNLTLLRGEEMKPVRTWPAGGKVTAGPFVRDGKVGCVVDRTKLVWIDPEKDQVLWQYRTAGSGIVGRPQVAGGLVVVAELSGRIVGLNRASGKPAGPGYTLASSAAPAATPVAAGDREALVPLTDGTVFVLALDRLKGAGGGP